jgi:4-hydroxy-3-methylbut-2-en-1-yl diphosphate reductase
VAAGLVQRVFVASPRGYCAGVERAVETVERALALYGAPVYVRKQIVHNAHVVDDLERRGAVFVEDETDAPVGAILVLSAHGVAPSVFDRSAARGQTTIDATCPLVTKVHVQARRYAAEGRRIVLIGHAGHEEVVGTMGEAPEAILLVESVEDAEMLELPVDTPLAYITQTTLSVDETAEIIQVLKRRFPQIHAPQREDICYATSNRLVEVARAAGVGAHLIEDETEIDERWLEGVETVGLTSGASAPERLVVRVCDWFRARGVSDITPFSSAYEDVVFRLPVELRRAEISAA